MARKGRLCDLFEPLRKRSTAAANPTGRIPEDLKQAISLLQDSRSDGDNLWFVLDGYHFGPEYQESIREAENKLLVIDDYNHLPHYHADVLLNQNLNAEQLIYSCEPYTRLLLGTRYGLLRSEFLSWIDYKREIPEVAQKLLVTLGGADPSNQTLTIVRAIQQLELERLETIVLIGPANPYVQTLQSVIKQSKFPIQLISNPDNIPELMAWADLAISASGSTVMEMLFMGLPALVIILAENQKTVAEALAETDVAVNLGWYQDLSAAQIAREMTELVEATDVRSEMSQRGRHLVDGKGAERVLAKLLTA
jgi:UDP-2,4-diacetamido-2,4,6-trideoxy-beta-L-altropyranose hydrolase